MELKVSINSPIIRECLERLEAEWKAFGRAHKFMDKPAKDLGNTLHSLAYGQGKLWSQADHIADSQRLNDRDKLKG